jgi:A/G-specific adenine glycosylase
MPARRKQSKVETWPVARRRNARRRLLGWYRCNARDLPWRKTRNPYAIWVSEIMLQQTQVATVERYFAQFLAAFPTVAALANAPEDRVLRLWEGLGYYRRARQMHAAAKKIVADHDGRFPRDPEAVRQLPGIGRYTAGAILSIAFDARTPILEANTIRLLCRLLALRGNPATSSAQKCLWQAAEDFLPQRGGSGELNQALMELGSLICTPRNPRCNACPLETLCPTHRDGLHHRIPAMRGPPVTENLHEAAVIIVNDRGKILLRKCQAGERWAGLWDFPRFSIQVGNRKSEVGKAIVDGVRRLTGIVVTRPSHFAMLRHTVTRFRITLNGYVARAGRSIHCNNGRGELRWVSPRDLGKYPLSTTGRKLSQLWRNSASS